jgi:hypothetical protein
MVREISSHLHDAADFVRLHAVCRPWRESAPSPATIRPRFLPWPLAVRKELLLHLPLNMRRISSRTTSPYDGCNGVLLPRTSSSGDKNWVARADGKAAWFLTVRPEPTMTDLITGATTVLPRFRENNDGGEIISRRMEKSRGIVYSDGTIFVYSIASNDFTAAVLRPGVGAWTIAEKRTCFGANCILSAAYHAGTILVCVNLKFWFVLTPDFICNGAAGGGRLEMRSNSRDAKCSYIFESGNELMWATVISRQNLNDLTSTLSVTLHALVGANSSGKVRWVARDGQSLKDRVLFLGSPASFTTEATTRLGGCAYLFFDSRVYKYNLINGVAEAKLTAGVRVGWASDKAHVWLQPHPIPTIAPISEIREKLKRL